MPTAIRIFSRGVGGFFEEFVRGIQNFIIFRNLYIAVEGSILFVGLSVCICSTVLHALQKEVTVTGHSVSPGFDSFYATGIVPFLCTSI